MSAPIWIREADISGLSLGRVISLLRGAMNREASGSAVNMEKTHVGWIGGNMHAIGAVFADAGLLGVKTWAHTAKGATPLEILWDAETGKLLAIIEAFAMGQLRTAGMAGLATDCLADPHADVLAICGTGKQALAQVAAVAAVRPLRQVRVYGRNAERRENFAARLRDQLKLRVEAFNDVGKTVADVPITTLITRATAPFLLAGMPARGAHINAMGAITPERSEFEPKLLDRCAVVAVDSLAQAQALSAELIAAWGKGFAHPSLTPLSQLVAAKRRRPPDADLTLFKSLGVGIADLALAEEIYRLTRERGVGVELPTPAPKPLEFTASLEKSS
jgi:ornithine cyclodeaminase